MLYYMKKWERERERLWEKSSWQLHGWEQCYKLIITHKKTAFRCNVIYVKMGKLQTKFKYSQFILTKITLISVLHTQFCNFTTFANTVNPQFYLFVGTPQNDVKSSKYKIWEHCSYRHLTRPVQKVGKITENTKHGNVKSDVTVFHYLLHVHSTTEMNWLFNTLYQPQ